MQRTSVGGTRIASVGYDPDQAILEIEFTRPPGCTWQYNDVPADIAEGQLNASSPGQYFDQYIKGVFPGRRIA